jgi:hypothetical protein
MPEMPEWVQVWTWLRFMRNPSIRVPLPQQEPDPEAMSEERYYELRDEWTSSGSPALSTSQIVAAMGAGAEFEDSDFTRATSDEDDIPF